MCVLITIVKERSISYGNTKHRLLRVTCNERPTLQLLSIPFLRGSERINMTSNEGMCNFAEFGN